MSEWLIDRKWCGARVGEEWCGDPCNTGGEPLCCKELCPHIDDKATRPTTEEAEKAVEIANEEIDRIFWVCDSRAEKDAKVKDILNKLIKMITGGE